MTPARTRLASLLHSEVAPALVLLLSAAVAMILANSPAAGAYHHILHDPLPISPLARLPSLHHWINDGLMALFFLVVGLEIKQALRGGPLSTPAARTLPVIAAAAGMVVPAIIYLVMVDFAPRLSAGWAIPAATDIAFAVGILALVGRSIPASLRVFLLTVAIVDDIGAVIIIAAAYTAGVEMVWLLAAVLVFGVMLACNRAGVRHLSVYLLLALGLWLAVLNSGVHPTIAGIAAAFTLPDRRDSAGDSPLLRLEHILVPLSAWLVVPLFGLANAGVELRGLTDASLALPLAIAVALFIGKQIGVLAAVAISVRLGIARRIEGANWLHIWGVALLCGIGFTMSLFIGGLAFSGRADLIDEAKLGVLVGSSLSAMLGYAVLKIAGRRPA